jgi:hypothetical protein
LEPSHHTTLDGRVMPAVPSTHFSATLVRFMDETPRCAEDSPPRVISIVRAGWRGVKQLLARE